MMIFLESPWLAIGIGIFAEALLALILWRTGRGVILWAMGGVLLLVLGGVLLERLVETDGERIEAALDGAAAALEANDLDRVNTFIAEDAVDPRSLARWAFAQVKFTKATLSRLDISINRLTTPPTARVAVSGHVMVQDRRGVYPYEYHPLKGAVELRQGPDRWLVTGYKMAEDPRKL